MKRPVGWSYFLPLGNVIDVVDAIVKYVRDARRGEDRNERSLNVFNDEGWGMIFYNECDASNDSSYTIASIVAGSLNHDNLACTFS
jgi:hypothetical protein